MSVNFDKQPTMMESNTNPQLKSDMEILKQKYLTYKKFISEGLSKDEARVAAELHGYDDFLANIASLLSKEKVTEDEAILIASHITFND